MLPLPSVKISGDQNPSDWTYSEGRIPQMALVVKNLPASAGDTRNAGSTRGTGRSPGGLAPRSSILAWRTPWTEKPGGPQPMG